MSKATSSSSAGASAGGGIVRRKQSTFDATIGRSLLSPTLSPMAASREFAFSTFGGGTQGGGGAGVDLHTTVAEFGAAAFDVRQYVADSFNRSGIHKAAALKETLEERRQLRHAVG